MSPSVKSSWYLFYLAGDWNCLHVILLYILVCSGIWTRLHHRVYLLQELYSLCNSHIQSVLHVLRCFQRLICVQHKWMDSSSPRRTLSMFHVCIIISHHVCCVVLWYYTSQVLLLSKHIGTLQMDTFPLFTPSWADPNFTQSQRNECLQHVSIVQNTTKCMYRWCFVGPKWLTLFVATRRKSIKRSKRDVLVLELMGSEWMSRLSWTTTIKLVTRSQHSDSIPLLGEPRVPSILSRR